MHRVAPLDRDQQGDEGLRSPSPRGGVPVYLIEVERAIPWRADAGDERLVSA